MINILENNVLSAVGLFAIMLRITVCYTKGHALKFEDYEKNRERLYAEFAELVKFILEATISAAAGVPRPQSVQWRAKAAASLKPKLQFRGLLASESVEREIKDLAGVRLCGRSSPAG